jgi:hypothetical protein
MDVEQALSCYISGDIADNGKHFDNINPIAGSVTGIKLR